MRTDTTMTTDEASQNRTREDGPRFGRSMEARARAYAVVSRAIAYLQKHAEDQPSLDELGRHVGLSATHLQRVFADWAGISPKRFLQVMGSLRARRALVQHDVLGASMEAGLSSPGRLHDLVVSCEAVTPGELRSGGAGLELRWGTTPSPLGNALVARTDRGVCHVEFLDESEDPADGLQRTWPGATLREDTDAAIELVEQIFGASEPRPLHLLVKGTNFQVQVWRAVLRTPPASTTSYRGLAESLGRPTAARAVAGAVARNHVGVLIPCHRVLREGGALGGYRWGVARKAAALVLEGHAADVGANDARSREPGRGHG